MRVPFSQLDNVGVVRDVPDYLTAINAWTDARNVRMRDGKVERTDGYKAVMDPPTVAPYWLLPVISAAKEHGVIYTGLTKVYTFLSATHSNITRQSAGVDVDYNATADGLWNGGLLAGIPVINNGVDVPQFWATVSGSTRLADLTNWPSGWTCKVIRPYRNFLVAMDLTESGTRYPNRFRWSHPAQPNGIPSSWDDTDPTKDAGINELNDVQAGGIVDGVVLRDTMVLYKERSTWGLQFTGGEQKMRTFGIFENVGALADHCAVAIGDGGKHFVFTGEDLIVHDGQQLQSVADTRLRRWLKSNISSANYGRSFVVPNNDKKEIWTCIPLEGEDWPSLAAIWNMKDNTFTYRELTNASFIAPSVIPSDVSDPWDSDTDSWDADTTSWATLGGVTYARDLLQADPVDTKLFRMDTTSQFDGSDFTAYVEKTGISVYGVDNNGNPLGDIEQNKLVRSIYPRATGGTMQVQVGRQEIIEGPISWGPVHAFMPGVDQKVDVLDDLHGACKLYAIRYSWPTGSDAQLRSFDIDVEPLGLF